MDTFYRRAILLFHIIACKLNLELELTVKGDELIFLSRAMQIITYISLLKSTIIKILIYSTAMVLSLIMKISDFNIIFWLLFHAISSVHKIFFLRYKCFISFCLSFRPWSYATIRHIADAIKSKLTSSSWLWAGNVQKIIVGFTLNVWLSPVREDPWRVWPRQIWYRNRLLLRWDAWLR